VNIDLSSLTSLLNKYFELPIDPNAWTKYPCVKNFRRDLEVDMRKVQFTAVFWTLFLAVPFTALALSLAAYMTENLGQIMNSFNEFSTATSAGGKGLIVEMAERWPEVAGMIIGQLVIMTILLFTWRSRQAENPADNRREN
jgi:hypothetical protein